jgi:hypothetical protein
MNAHELPSTLAAISSEDLSMGIIYVLCAIILVAPVVMFVVGIWMDIRDWRRTSAEEPAPVRRGGSESAAILDDQPRSSVRR